jgi:hypothetical protein
MNYELIALDFLQDRRYYYSVNVGISFNDSRYTIYAIRYTKYERLWLL